MKPVRPARRAAISNEAKTAKAVRNDGTATPYVSTVWSIFHFVEIPGSMNS